MTYRRNQGAAPERQSGSSHAVESWRPTQRSVVVALSALAMILTILAALHQWNLRQIPSRSEVRKAVSRLEPACKPILQARFRDRLIREGRPLTRGEVDELTSGIQDCEKIDQQMNGLQEE